MPIYVFLQLEEEKRTNNHKLKLVTSELDKAEEKLDVIEAKLQEAEGRRTKYEQ